LEDEKTVPYGKGGKGLNAGLEGKVARLFFGGEKKETSPQLKEKREERCHLSP